MKEVTMHRRLYFLFPTESDARRVANEIRRAGIDEKHIHTVAGPAGKAPGAPQGTGGGQDKAGRVEHWLWNANLALFGMALIGLIASLFWGFSLWSALAIGVMLATFFVGERFTSTIPNVHLDEFQDALKHSEILLMVDVPKAKVVQIEELVHRRHPEATVGGVGWSLDALHT
jgi:hypothetical protein